MEERLYHENNAALPVMLSLIVAIISVGLLIFTLYITMVTDEFSLTSSTGTILVATAVMMIMLAAFLFLLRIKITVTYTSLTVGVLRGRVVPIEDIRSVEAEDFSAFKDYFGWGVKIGRRGLGYIVAGTSRGLRIYTKEGISHSTSFFISSKRTFEFESAMNAALKAKKDDRG
ncbi:MAG: hypothetical protein LBV13_03800 [Methanomassiliicoccaceae archaeon]|jgi:hypothetical protein|nr:hypothetical protein [Methanomassiliicoccaceae archaeon]